MISPFHESENYELRESIGNVLCLVGGEEGAGSSA